jgi:valyl-tRNA synthetase
LVAATGTKKPKLYFASAPLLEEQAKLIERLGRLGAVTEAPGGSHTGFKLVGTKYDAWLDIDKNAVKAYADKLHDQKSVIEAKIKQLEGRLANSNYVEKAPKELVEETKTQLQHKQELLAKVNSELASFANSLES